VSLLPPASPGAPDSHFRGIRRFLRHFTLLAVILWAAPASGQNDAQTDAPDDSPQAVVSRHAQTPAAGGQSAAGESQADRILAMRRLLDSDRKQKAAFEAEQASLGEQFENSAAEFERIDQELTQARARLEQGVELGVSEPLEKTIDRLQRARLRARERFELVIDRRKAVQQQLITLNEKLELVQEYLDRLTSGEAARGGAKAVIGPPPGMSPTPQPTPGVVPPGPSGSPLSLLPGSQGTSTPAPDAAPPSDAEQLDEELKVARRDRTASLEALRSAQFRITQIDHATDVFERDLVNAREILRLADRAFKADEAALKSMDARLDKRRAADENEEELARFTGRRSELQKRVEAERLDLDAQTDRVAKSQTVLDRLKRSRNDAAKLVLQRDAELDSIDRRVWFLSSPIAPYQLGQWASNKGPRVVAVILAALAVYWVTRLIGGRMVGKVVRRSHRGGLSERESRAETLRRVFDSTTGAAIIILGLLSALNQAGINVTVLLGGAAVIGAAIAFGSQNLIKDFFSGFMILMENQYSVGNVIKVGAVTGTVENITLRMTSIRDLEGVLHFIPHSQVLSVSNLTYGWSRIVMDIKVNAEEDPDRVIESLLGVGRRLKADAAFGSQLIGEPEMLGVDAIGGGATVVKLLVKTTPLNRWPVKRELLRRIKKQFDADGIRLA